MRKVVREKGCWVWDSKRCRNIFKPGTCRIVKVKCAPREICKKVWVPEVQKKQIKCVRYERETVKKQVPYTVCKMVKEVRTKQVPYTVCKPVKQQKTVTVCKRFPRKVAYTATRFVPKTVCVEVPVKVHCRLFCHCD